MGKIMNKLFGSRKEELKNMTDEELSGAIKSLNEYILGNMKVPPTISSDMQTGFYIALDSARKALRELEEEQARRQGLVQEGEQKPVKRETTGRYGRYSKESVPSGTVGAAFYSDERGLGE